jgi:hypothetical protein
MYSTNFQLRDKSSESFFLQHFSESTHPPGLQVWVWNYHFTVRKSASVLLAFLSTTSIRGSSCQAHYSTLTSDELSAMQSASRSQFLVKHSDHLVSGRTVPRQGVCQLNEKRWPQFISPRLHWQVIDFPSGNHLLQVAARS